MLRNIEAKQQAEEFIRSLSEFCRQLETDQQSRQVLPPMRLVDTYTSKPFRSTSSSTPAPPSPSSSSSEPTLNLNTSVLDLITKLNKPKKSLPPISGDDDDDDDDSSGKDDDNDHDSSPRETSSARSTRSLHSATSDHAHDDELGSINDRRKRRQSGASATSLQQQNASLPTAELVHRYTDCKDTRKSNAILIELSRRSQGKSTGPLVSPTDIGTFTRYTQLYGAQDAPTLSHLYLQLQQRISNMTEPDILNIARVPSDLLLEIAALYTLIAQKNQQQQQGQGPNRDGNMANEGSFERPPDHIAAAMLMKAPTPVSQAPMGYYPSVSTYHPGGATTNTSGTHFKPIPMSSANAAHVHPSSLQAAPFSPPPPPPTTPSSAHPQSPVPLASFNGRMDRCAVESSTRYFPL